MSGNTYYKCNQEGECFGRSNQTCMVLTELFPQGKCPFQKADREKSIGHIRFNANGSLTFGGGWTSLNEVCIKHGREVAEDAYAVYRHEHPERVAEYREITVVKKDFDKYVSNFKRVAPAE